MRNVLRSPLTWMVVVELVIVGAMVAVAWTVVASASRPALASPLLPLPDATDDGGSPLPDLPQVTPGQRGPLPGLNVDTSFWRTRLAELNRDEALFVQLEWRIVHSAMDAIKRYLESVVMPAIQRAEHAGVGS